MADNKNVLVASRFTDYDIHLFREGKHYRLYDLLGSHLMEKDGQQGVYFAVWAPNADWVGVAGNFNKWDKESHQLFPRWDESGIWEGFIRGIGQEEVYKYIIQSNADGGIHEKGDPFARTWEVPPNTASMVWELDYDWGDGNWLRDRKKSNSLRSPISVYEVHLGSWMKKADGSGYSLTYRELADELVPYVREMGFSHVELMPVMEHPFFGSWGYQVTGFFAPSSRYGTPEDFMYLVDQFHQNGIGIYLDWVPSHFPNDAHGLYRFDGSALYEHQDPKKGYHPDWSSYIFNYGRNEVRSFLISNALFWLDQYHADGLRVDAVASMLYLDYSREEGEWEPNEYGGNENLEAISLLKELNEQVYSKFPDAQTIAEESTSWPGVSRPTYEGGLGFGMKWMMGWMHDVLKYFAEDPVNRSYHHNEVTFSLLYAFHENFMLPLSHDEVVHGKSSLLYKMPGDDWQRFANLRVLFSYMFTHPGSKLLFMGGEFAQTSEWNHDQGLQWNLLEFAPHQGIKKVVMALNKLYRSEPALYDFNFSPVGFEWIVNNDSANSVIVFVRKGTQPADKLVVVCNFTPVPRHDYRFGVPVPGDYREIFNSDDAEYGGSDLRNEGDLKAEMQPMHGRTHSVSISLPPLGAIVLKKSD